MAQDTSVNTRIGKSATCIQSMHGTIEVLDRFDPATGKVEICPMTGNLNVLEIGGPNCIRIELGTGRVFIKNVEFLPAP